MRVITIHDMKKHVLEKHKGTPVDILHSKFQRKNNDKIDISDQTKLTPKSKQLLIKKKAGLNIEINKKHENLGSLWKKDCTGYQVFLVTAVVIYFIVHICC